MLFKLFFKNVLLIVNHNNSCNMYGLLISKNYDFGGNRINVAKIDFNYI